MDIEHKKFYLKGDAADTIRNYMTILKVVIVMYYFRVVVVLSRGSTRNKFFTFEVMVKFAYTLPFQDLTCETKLGMLLLLSHSKMKYVHIVQNVFQGFT